MAKLPLAKLGRSRRRRPWNSTCRVYSTRGVWPRAVRIFRCSFAEDSSLGVGFGMC
jgi:hypothetical protein